MLTAASVIKPPMWAPGRRESNLWRGCVLYLPMWEGGGSTVMDLSGNANNGTLTDVDWAAKEMGSALSFDTADNRVRIEDSSSLKITGAISIAAWVYIPTASVCDIISKSAGNFPAPFDFYIHDSGTIRFYMGNGGSFDNFNSTGAFPWAAWHHVAVTRDGANVVHYLDGGPNGVDTGFAPTTGDDNDEVYVGNRQDLAMDFNGFIAEVVVWNRSLPQYDIVQLAFNPFCMIRPTDFAPFWDVSAAAAAAEQPALFFGANW